MPELIEEEARSLFLYHAMVGKNVDEERIMHCVQQCYFYKGHGSRYHYHPLSLKVLGSQLGCDPGQWMVKLNEPDAFNQFQEQEHPIFSILRKSFDALRDEDQVLFMDVALFCPESFGSGSLYINNFQWLSILHGKNVDRINAQLQGLMRKSFLQSLGDGSTKFYIHDLWREFCMMETKCGKLKSRRWIYEEVHDSSSMQREESSLRNGGWKKLERICLMGRCSPDCKVILSFNSCKNLTTLKMVDIFLEDNLLDLSVLKNLMSLEISFALEKLRLPYTKNETEKIPRVRCGVDLLGLGSLKHLVVLKWDGIPSNCPRIEDISNLTSLRVLLLTSWWSNNKLPDFGRLTLLEHASFNHHEEMEMASISGLSSRMTNLRYLHLTGCRSLQSCHGVGDLVALEELRLTGCWKLEELPNLQQLRNLQILDLSGSMIKVLPAGLGDLVALLALRAQSCRSLAKLPNVRKLSNLQLLDLQDCPLNKDISGLSDLINLHELRVHINGIGDSADLHKLTKLQCLMVNGWSSHGSPGAASLVNLKILQICSCKGVDELVGLSNMTRLQHLIIDSSEFKDVSCLSDLVELQNVAIRWCKLLERFPDIHKVTKLEKLEIVRCENLREWEGVSGSRLRSLETSEVDFQSHGTLPKLQILESVGVPVAELPDLSKFPRLRSLRVYSCRGLERVTSIAPLTAIQDIELSGCKSLRVLPDLSDSKLLRKVKIVYCGVELNANETEKLKAMCPRIHIQS